MSRSHSQRTSGYVWERIWDTGVEKKRLDHEEVLSGVAVDAAVGSKVKECWMIWMLKTGVGLHE